MICLDTNYLILGLVPGSKESSDLAAWAAHGESLVTPMVAWYEFLCGPVTEVQIRTMRAFVRELLPFDETHAIVAAGLFNLAGRKRTNSVDAMIAATAIVVGAALATNNRADFSEFDKAGLTFA